MALRQFNPVTASLRGTILVNRNELWKGKPVKGLTEGKTHSGGRNNRLHHVPAHRRRAQADLPQGRLQAAQGRREGDGGAIEYDPNRTVFIALVKYQDGELAYILAPQRLQPATAWWRRARRHQAGQRDAAGGDAGRHDRPTSR